MTFYFYSNFEPFQKIPSPSNTVTAIFNRFHHPCSYYIHMQAQWSTMGVVQGYYVLLYILNSSLFENLFWGISRILWNSLKIPWNFKTFNPCLDMQLPWNMYPCPCLEIQGISRLTSFSPWNFSVTLNLEKPWNFLNRSPWHWLNLEFQGQFQGTLKFKAMIVLPTH